MELMINWYLSFLFYLFYLGVYSFIYNKEHLLSVLISLEFMTLILFTTISMIFFNSDYMFIPLLFLTIAVCEGALGLSILVMFARSKGGEYMEVSGLNMW